MEKPDIDSIKEDLKIQSDLSALANTNGGKILIKSLVKDVIDSIESIGYKHSTLTQQEFVSLGAKVRASIDLIQVLNGSDSNKDYYKKLLEEALQEVE